MRNSRGADAIGRVAVVARYCWSAIETALIIIAGGILFDLGGDMMRLSVMFGLVALTAVAATIVTGILVLTWVYRAMAVAHDISPELTISPGWAVGWYFVPVASLWKPYEAMREIWQGSAGSTRASGSHALINWWWAAWITRSLMGSFEWIVTRSGDGRLTHGDILVIALGAAAGVAAALLLSVIIRRINAMQIGAVEAGIFD